MPDPITHAVSTVASSPTFTDLEKTLLLVILAIFLVCVGAGWRAGAWIAKTAFPELSRLAMLLVTGLSDLKDSLKASDAEHTKRVDKLGVEVGAKVAGVGVKVDGLGVKVDALSGRVGDLAADVSRRLSGTEGALDGMVVELARSGSIPDATGGEPSGPVGVGGRHPTGAGLRAVSGGR